MCYSLKHKLPDVKSSEVVYSRPKVVRIWAEGREKKFMDEFIYLSFYSLSGASVDVWVNFTDEEVIKRKRDEVGKVNAEEIMQKLDRRIQRSQQEFKSRGSYWHNFR